MRAGIAIAIDEAGRPARPEDTLRKRKALVRRPEVVDGGWLRLPCGQSCANGSVYWDARCGGTDPRNDPE